MAKAIYMGIDSKARKIKKAYIGIDGKARKIKKIYIGVDGKARLVWGGGARTPGTLASTGISFTNNFLGNGGLRYCGSKFAFYGGAAWYTYTTPVNAINTSLTLTVCDTLSYHKSRGAVSGIENNAIFAGNSANSLVAECYNESLSKSFLTDLSTYNGYYSTTGTVGNYALFAGGYCYSSGYSYGTSNISTYNTSLTKGTTSLSKGSFWSAGHKSSYSNSHVLFAGGTGYNSEQITTVDAFNTSLTRSSVSDLTGAGNSNYNYEVGCGASVDGTHLLYMNATHIIEVYSSSLTKLSSITTSIFDNVYHFGVSTDDYAVFSGHGTVDGSFKTIIELYNASLTKSNVYSLSTSCGNGCGIGYIGNNILVPTCSSGAIKIIPLS